jgi:predicted aminopeptidase
MATMRFPATALAGCAALAATGCTPYLAQAVAGQAELLRARRPVSEVIADQRTPPDVRAQLGEAERALAFAHTALALPDNGSYRQYADLGRRHVVWNVFAAPEFSLALRTWCFPVAGCVGYRGYFREADARAYAADLAQQGFDVHVAGAAAYSTLGFFRDPLLNTFVAAPAPALPALLFHELAHQRVYVAGDTQFSESFASLVEQEGVIRWLGQRGEEALLCRYLAGLERAASVRRLVAASRARLATIYAGPGDDGARRVAKAAEIARLRAGYRALREGWAGPPYFDAAFDGVLNNASLGAAAAYDGLVGTLRVILDGEGGDLAAFYDRIERLARLDRGERARVLAHITSRAESPAAARCRAGPA